MNLGIEVPTNLYPTSGGTTTSSGSSNSGSNSFAGINWNSPAAAGILEQLMASANGLPGVVNNMGQTLQGQYSNLMQQAMGPQGFQGTMNQMGARNMLNSSVTGDALAKAQAHTSQAIGNQAFNSMLAQQQAQMQVPGLLADVARLGQESRTNAFSNSSQSSNSNTQSSNPLAPYQLLGSMLPTLLNYSAPAMPGAQTPAAVPPTPGQSAAKQSLDAYF